MNNTYLRNALILVARRLYQQSEQRGSDDPGYVAGMADLIATLTTPLGTDVDQERDNVMEEICHDADKEALS